MRVKLSAALLAFTTLCLINIKSSVVAYIPNLAPLNSDPNPPERSSQKLNKIDNTPKPLVVPPSKPKLSLKMKRSTKQGMISTSPPSTTYGYGRYNYLPSVAVPGVDENLVEPQEGRFARWKQRISKVSNIASLLCVVDCTLLPIITVIFPLLGWVASPSQMNWIHALGHSVAMYFVIPVGGFAAMMNYLSHKRPKLSLPAAIGLTLIYLANGHGGPILSKLPHGLRHALHCGTILHRVTNICGCALLLGSNYFSHRAGCTHTQTADGKPCCVWGDPSKSGLVFSWEK